jgi:hypothetical protein
VSFIVLAAIAAAVAAVAARVVDAQKAPA